jgi:hypothetical protein
MAVSAMQGVVQTMQSHLSDAATQQKGCEDIYRILYEQESMDVWVRAARHFQLSFFVFVWQIVFQQCRRILSLISYGRVTLNRSF